MAVQEQTNVKQLADVKVAEPTEAGGDARAGLDSAELVESLVEDVSIDGMCGVY
jgi:mycofactocin precursor